MNAAHFNYSPAVAEALDRGLPIVALETTILTHGMPYPQNLEAARAVEADVRAGGAVPATIAVHSGSVHVGLDDGRLEELATAHDVLKLSRADLPYALARRRSGATTVAATMICAHRAGIAVFATGGIGGVHRGAENSFDVSADLTELSRTPVIVVCAGAKALLDLPKTLEVLETLGVGVGTYQSDEFPAFWSRVSGLRTPLRFDDVEDVVEAFAAARALGFENGLLVANPVPSEAEIPNDVMTGVIARAVKESARHGISGKAVTPWLLERIRHLTGGHSLGANIALVRNNARLAAAIATALTQNRRFR